MPPQDNHRKAVNIQELKEIMDDDMELIQECFTDFIQDWPQLYAQIKDAVRKQDAQALNESAHRLKGTLRYLAADLAANAAYALESAGRDNDMENLDGRLSTLKNECRKLIDYIKNFTP